MNVFIANLNFSLDTVTLPFPSVRVDGDITDPNGVNYPSFYTVFNILSDGDAVYLKKYAINSIIAFLNGSSPATPYQNGDVLFVISNGLDSFIMPKEVIDF